MENIIYRHKFTFDIFNIILYANDKSLLAIDLGGLVNFNENIVDNKNYIIEMTETQLIEYFNGKRKIFTIPLEDKSRNFENKVYKELISIHYGETITYKELGQKAGKENAARAVGNAMAKNVFPIIIPCHRVVKSDGKIGNYTGGVNIKTKLLEIEKRFKD